jgi:hypothetical protein
MQGGTGGSNVAPARFGWGFSYAGHQFRAEIAIVECGLLQEPRLQIRSIDFAPVSQRRLGLFLSPVPVTTQFKGGRRAAQLMETEDAMVALDCMRVLQETMAHFYYKAKVLLTLKEDADFDAIDSAMSQAAHWAVQLAASNIPSCRRSKSMLPIASR